MAKGISVLSGVIFLALIAVSVFLVYQSGMPTIRNIHASATMEKMKDVFSEMDNIIQQTASEGKGSKRNLQLKVDAGSIKVNGTQDTITWELETSAEIVSPRTSQKIGNIIVGANMETVAYEGNYTYSSPQKECYIMDNGHLLVYIRKIGSQSSMKNYNTSSLLVALYNRNTGEWLNSTGFLDISVDSNSTSKTGSGYTTLLETGNNLPYATVTAYMNSTRLEYWVNFTLESGADFLELESSA